MSFGKHTATNQWSLDYQHTEEVVQRALDMGLNFFETANVYAEGTSEEYLGKALRANKIPRDKVVIASKVYFNPGRLSSKAIHHEIDETLKRLGTDYLDLYIIHRFDYNTPIAETMEALNDLVKAGKVRAIGASAMFGYQFHNMQIFAKDITAPIVGSTKVKHLESAIKALEVKLAPEEIDYLDELYTPHSIIGAIDHNPPAGTVILDKK